MPEAGRVWRVLQAESKEQHQIEIDLHSIAETVEIPPSAGTAPPAPTMAGRTNERMVDYMSINGRFTKVATTENSIVVGLIGSLTSENIAHDDILKIASFYGANTDPDKFGYHFITADGAKSRGCKLPTNNYNGFIEIFV